MELRKDWPELFKLSATCFCVASRWVTPSARCFGGITLGADGAFDGLSDRLGLLGKSHEIGLRGSAALCCGIADCSVQFLCGSSDVIERIFDIRLYFPMTGSPVGWAS